MQTINEFNTMQRTYGATALASTPRAGVLRQGVSFILKYKLLHIGYWLYLALAFYHDRVAWGDEMDEIIFDLIFSLTSSMACVYYCIYVLIPRLLNRQKYLLFALAVLATVTLATITDVTLQNIHEYFDTGRRIKNNPLLLLINFIPTLRDALLFIAGTIIVTRYKTERHNRRLEKERLEAELNFLKAQINPHFLFNALNSIYVLISMSPNTAQSTLMQFSNLLRYQLYECTSDAVLLEREISFLKDYLELEKMRNGDNLEVIFEPPDKIVHFYIAPFLLITFAENAFKYVSRYTDKPNRIRVQMTLSPEMFEFSIANTYDEAAMAHIERGGIGLQNVKRRLELLYRGNHELRIERKGGVYSVNLKLPAR